MAEAITSIYSSVLNQATAPTGNGNEGVVSWSDDQPHIARLSWEDVAVSLARANRIELLIKPVDFPGGIRSIVTSPAVPIGIAAGDPAEIRRYTEYDRIRAWGNKLRLHLRVLLAIHSRILGQGPLLAPDLRVALLQRVEEEIHALLATHAVTDLKSGTLDLFDDSREVPASGANI